jgi:hypothetical protein
MTSASAQGSRSGLPITLVSTALAISIASFAAAKDHVVALGGDWPKSEALAPGDRILLAPGVHPSRSVEKYPGTPDDPILITSADPMVPAALAGQHGPAFRATACGSLAMVGVLIIGGGIEVDGGSDDPTGSLALTAIQILPFSRAPETDGPEVGIRVSNLSTCELRSVGVSKWTRIGVHATDVADLRMSGVGLKGTERSRVGMRLENCTAVTVSGGGIVAAGEICVDVASDRSSSVTTLNGVVMVDAGVVLRASGAASITADRCTIIEPRLAVAEALARSSGEDPKSRPQAGPRVHLDRCLVSWQVGRLARLFNTPETSDTHQGVTLGSNLWWSQELPAAIEPLGGFPAGSEPQEIRVDPRLVPRTWLPDEPKARDYGYGAPKTPVVDPG